MYKLLGNQIETACNTRRELYSDYRSFVLRGQLCDYLNSRISDIILAYDFVFSRSLGLQQTIRAEQVMPSATKQIKPGVVGIVVAAIWYYDPFKI